MRSKLMLAFLTLVVAVQCMPRTQTSDGKASVFVLHINQPVDPAFVTITYLVKGAEGSDGYANWGLSGPNLQMTETQDIPISLSLPGGHQATAIKAVLFCRGFGLSLVDVPSLADSRSKRVAVDLVPLGSVALVGRVKLPKGAHPSDFLLDVYYANTLSLMGYFDATEAIGGNGMKVATTALAANGSFKMAVPDFARDPVALKLPGRISFNIRSLRPSEDTLGRPWELHIAGRTGIGLPPGIPMALSYPAPIDLELHWGK